MNNLEYIRKYLPKDKWEEGEKLLNSGVSPQYIVGNVDFYRNIIKVDKRVLIPRFETELLVEKTINYINKLFDKKIKILDIGTGSGCIAISIKKNIDCDMYASDISLEALDVVRDNIKSNNVLVELIHSDIFSNINGKYDVIISNPPYISYDEDIEDIVKNNEPNMALYALDNGLYYYDKILKECSNYLNNKYLIAFEIGYRQGDNIRGMVDKYFGKDINVRIEKDYSGKDRYVFIWN